MSARSAGITAGLGIVALGRSDDIRALAASFANEPIGAAYRAAADGRIALANVIDPGAPFPGRLVKATERRSKPVLVVVGDDPIVGTSLGPEGWLCARRLSTWAACAVLHAAAGEREHYLAAVEAAERHGRAALIECSSATLPLWAGFLRARHRLTIEPRGGLHPVAPVLH